MKSAILACALMLLAVGICADQQSALFFDGNSWWEHVRVLADDNMEGRDTGSEGLRRAQAYVVEQLQKDGLRPAGVKGYYQPVKFVTRRIVEQDCSLALVRNGTQEPLVLGDDAFFSTRTDLAAHTSAPLVFVGFALQVPENKYDDFAGQDLKGKIAVYISGSPAEIPAALASHYQSAAERGKALRRAGAVGNVAIPNPASMDIPWSRMSLNRTHPSMALAGKEFRDPAALQVAVIFNPAQAEKLFTGSGHTFSELAELAKDRKPMPRFPLAVSLDARAKMEKTPVESANLAAVLPGSDPKLKNEYVLLSAHLDHLGIGEPINGDRIYNGAMDNGSGSAVLLDIAASFQSHPEKLRRSILFLWVTAEEKGLLGSRYFAANPTVPENSMVADVNVDMFLPIVPLKVLCVLGLAESDLGDRARAVAEAHGVQVQPDPEPLRNRFIRSDQYNFIQHGIPAVKMDNSFLPGSPEQKIFKDWLTNRYHAPSDDLDQPVDLAAAALYEQVTRDLLINVANGGARPEWKPNSFFRRFAKGAQWTPPSPY
jgi:Zn-dependent M28 family amino/carboxypeptidase